MPSSHLKCARREQLRDFHDRYLLPDRKDTPQPGAAPKDTPDADPLPERDGQLPEGEFTHRLSRAMDDPKFAALWMGDRSGYPSASEAVGALVFKLVFYFGDSWPDVDKAFRMSGQYSDHWVEKWERLGEREYGHARAKSTERFTLPPDWDVSATQERLQEMFRVNVEDTGDRDIVGGQEAQPGKDTRRIRGYRLDDLDKLKPPSWLVRNFLPSDSLAQLFGESGTYKTFIALDIALSVASGKAWLNTYPVKSGPVVYLSGEGNAAIKYRIRAWMAHHNRPYPSDCVIVPTSFDFVRDFAAVARVAADDLGKRPALTVVDTLNRYFGPNDENSTKDMTAFVHAVDRYRTLTGGGVLIVHHTGWAVQQRERGNYALRAACDAILNVEKTLAGCVVKTVKQKDTEPDEVILRASRVDLGHDADGLPLTSLALGAQERWSSKFMFLPNTRKDYLADLWAWFGASRFTQADARKREGEGADRRRVSERFGDLTKAGMLRQHGDAYDVEPGVRYLLHRG